MCLLLLTQNWMLVDGSFIACISFLVLKIKTIHFHREQNRSSQTVCMDYFARELFDSSTKVTDSLDSDVSSDGAALDISHVMNEQITYIPRNSRLL